LFGIVNAHGLPVAPPEQDTPLTLQLENFQLLEGVAVTEIDDPTPSEQPLGQFGLTVPEPEVTPVVKACVGGEDTLIVAVLTYSLC
jgi:hypothetical protein